jgi:16S rRNA processing protein RimM
VNDRSGAEQIAGIFLAGEGDLDPPEGEFWPEDLEGAVVELADGTAVGTVREVLENPAHDLLAVVLPDGREVLVPFVEAIVLEFDEEAGRVVIDPPAGLLDE